MRQRGSIAWLLWVAATVGCGGGNLPGPDGSAAVDLTTPPPDLAAPVDRGLASDLSLVDLAGAPTVDQGGCGPCMPRFLCCGGACVNPDNDILNCGRCGNACEGPNPYCHQGACGVPPCSALTCGGGQLCCGGSCCGAGQLCCDLFGPVVLLQPQCTTPTTAGTCPAGCTACVCNPEGTLIAGPAGSRRIETLSEGDLVYSVDHGRIAIVPIVRVHRVPVHDHVMVRVAFAGGTVIRESPRHPTADGRAFSQLAAGDEVDGLRVVETSIVPYAGGATWDILPDSDSGAYFAGGVLVGSTLAPAPAIVPPGLSPICPGP